MSGINQEKARHSSDFSDLVKFSSVAMFADALSILTSACATEIQNHYGNFNFRGSRL